MGKFESSHTGCTTDVTTGQAGFTGNEMMQIKANVTSWRNITIGNSFTMCLNMNKASNPYGLNTSDNIVDPHLVKNTEWGACAFLSKSKYGKEIEEVFINNSSDFITGNAGNTASASSAIGITNEYHTLAGQKASTTGNIYGIYDMSGGAWEKVAAYVNNNHDELQTNGKSVVENESRYKNVYNIGSNGDAQGLNYDAAASKYGDAIYETSANGYSSLNASWYENYSGFADTNAPFFYRGGGCRSDDSAGMFFFDRYTGGSGPNGGFRLTIPIL